MRQGATWQQAVQWLPELHVLPGMQLPVLAKHDTYGISFEHRDDEGSDEPPASSGETVYPVTDASDSDTGAGRFDTGASTDGGAGADTVNSESSAGSGSPLEAGAGVSVPRLAMDAAAVTGKAGSMVGFSPSRRPAATGVPLKVRDEAHTRKDHS